VLAIALGLSSAVCWGVADFFGGIQTRRLPVVAVTLVSQATGLILAAIAVLAIGHAPPPARALALAAIAGATGVIALTAFYRALAIGTMSIVAPISAAGAALPVIVGLASGEHPSGLQLAGIGAAIVGVVLASREAYHDAERRAAGRLSIALALVAALGFGTFLVLIRTAAKEDLFWSLLISRSASVPTLALGALAFGAPVVVRRLDLPALAVIGVLDLGANALYSYASTLGLLSVIAVLGSLYPVTTVLLARLVLGERVRRIQEVGIATVLAGVALIAAA